MNRIKDLAYLLVTFAIPVLILTAPTEANATNHTCRGACRYLNSWGAEKHAEAIIAGRSQFSNEGAYRQMENKCEDLCKFVDWKRSCNISVDETECSEKD